MGDDVINFRHFHAARSYYHNTTVTPHSICYPAKQTSPTEQSPFREANRSSTSQQILRILWDPKVHHRVHKRPQTINPGPNKLQSLLLLSRFFKVRFNIILPSSLGFSSDVFPSGLPTKTLYALLQPPIHATCPPISFLIGSPK